MYYNRICGVYIVVFIKFQLCSQLICDLPQSVPSPVPLDSGEVSISSELDRKSKPFSASSASGSSLVSILAGDDDEGFFLMIWEKILRPLLIEQ